MLFSLWRGNILIFLLDTTEALEKSCYKREWWLEKQYNWKEKLTVVESFDFGSLFQQQFVSLPISEKKLLEIWVYESLLKNSKTSTFLKLLLHQPYRRGLTQTVDIATRWQVTNITRGVWSLPDLIAS